jgi:hypothetical protein
MEFLDVVWGDDSLEALLASELSPGGQALIQPSSTLYENLHQVESWLRQGMFAIEGKTINLISIQLGDVPELLSIEGYSLVDGQASADEVLDQVSDDTWDWIDDEDIIDFDSIERLGFHKVDDLPAPPYSFEDEDDDDDDEVYDDREAWWGLLVLCAMRNLVKNDGPRFASLLEEGLEAVPIFVGYEDAPELVAVLTRKGFMRPVEQAE